MINRSAWFVAPFLAALFVFCAGCQSTGAAAQDNVLSSPRVHYIEIVCTDVEEQCAALESVHGVTFGEAVPALGGARVAVMPSGSRFAVRAPMAAHETPIVRTYIAVDDIAQAVKDAEAAGGMIAYPPTVQGDTGTWAIYIQGGAQMGLWQPPAG